MTKNVNSNDIKSKLREMYVMEDESLTLDQNLKRFRKTHGMTQKELADKLGLTKETIYRYESGIQDPPLSNLIRIARLFRTSLDSLAGLDDREYIDISHLTDKQKQALRVLLSVHPDE